MNMRPAQPSDIEALATLWHDGWHDAHSRIVPEALVALRTPDSFRSRTASRFAEMHVMELNTQPAGFFLVSDDELDQFYVAPAARGTGAAAMLMKEAEDRFRTLGVTNVWLACAIGNMRAARFYEKAGWHRAGEQPMNVETSEGPYSLDVWRYEKRL